MGRRKISRARLIALILAAVLAVVMLHDTLAAPREAFGARLAIGAIDGYRAYISPHLSTFVRCRFKPTCSSYGRGAIEKYGVAKGGLKALGRIARCGPWTPAGTIDQP